MRKPDNGLRGIIRAKLPMVHWVTIESGSTEGGIPDMNGCYQGNEFWIECKATAANAVKFRPLQLGWHARRARSGGVSFIAVRKQTQTVDELWLYKGVDATNLSRDGMRGAVELGSWGGGQSRWGWVDFLKKISPSKGA